MDPVAVRPSKWASVAPKAVLDANGKRTGKIGYQRLQKVYVDDESKVIPYSVKANMLGDSDYIQPITEASIPVGSTPYPSALISRPIDFIRNSCGTGSLGTAPTVIIGAGSFGGEAPGDADVLAEAKFKTFNNQQYANEQRACELNNTPVHFALLHKILMDGSLKVIGSDNYGPVVDVRVAGVEIISNTVGVNPPVANTPAGTVAAYVAGRCQVACIILI